MKILLRSKMPMISKGKPPLPPRNILRYQVPDPLPPKVIPLYMHIAQPHALFKVFLSIVFCT